MDGELEPDLNSGSFTHNNVTIKFTGVHGGRDERTR